LRHLQSEAKGNHGCEDDEHDAEQESIRGTHHPRRDGLGVRLGREGLLYAVQEFEEPEPEYHSGPNTAPNTAPNEAMSRAIRRENASFSIASPASPAKD